MANVDVIYPSNRGKLGYVVDVKEIVAAIVADEDLLQEIADAIDALE